MGEQNPSETRTFFRRVVIDIRFAIHREQYGATWRFVVMHRTRPAPDVIPCCRNPVMILDAALQDKGLLDLRVFVKGNVSARFELEQASHLAALGIGSHLLFDRVQKFAILAR